MNVNSAFEVDAVDAVADRFKNQLALARGQVQRLLGLVLLGHIHAVVENEGPFAGQLHAAAAEGDAAIDAVAAAQRQRALPLLLRLQRAQAFLERGRPGARPSVRSPTRPTSSSAR